MLSLTIFTIFLNGLRLKISISRMRDAVRFTDVKIFVQTNGEFTSQPLVQSYNTFSIKVSIVPIWNFGIDRRILLRWDALRTMIKYRNGWDTSCRKKGHFRHIK